MLFNCSGVNLRVMVKLLFSFGPDDFRRGAEVVGVDLLVEAIVKM